VYTQTGVGALRSNRRIVVVTVLTRKSSLTALLVLNMAAFRGKVAPSIVGASAGDRAQLTCTRDHRLQCRGRALCANHSLSSLGFCRELTRSGVQS
jgi:hypothetical protein